MDGTLQQLYRAKQYLLAKIVTCGGSGNALAEPVDFELALCPPVSGMTLDKLLGYVEGRIFGIEVMLKLALGDAFAKGVIAKLTVAAQSQPSIEQSVANKPTGCGNGSIS